MHKTSPSILDRDICANAVTALANQLRLFKQQTGAQSLVLYHAASDVFLVRLLAAAHAGFDVIFPANGQPENIQIASEDADYVLVDEFSGDKHLSLDSLTLTESLQQSADALTLPESGKLTFYTSGSTGYGKPVVKSWQHINAELTNLCNTFEFDSDCQIVATVSHQHIYGLLFKLFWPLRANYTVNLTFVEFPEQLRALVATQPSVIITSPAFIDRLIRDNVCVSVKHNIAGVFSSGGPLSDNSAVTLFQQLGVAATQIYGSTETGGIAYRQVSEFKTEPWQCFDGITVLKHQQQLAVKSPYFDDAMFVTQDCGEILEGGRFSLSGRLDRTIKLEEKRVNLDALERVLSDDSAITQCKVVLLTHGFRQQLGLVAQLSAAGLGELNKNGKLALNKRLKQVLAGQFEAVCMPRKFRYVDELPVNSQGKYVFAELEKLFD